jgi:DUF1365 family protein
MKKLYKATIYHRRNNPRLNEFIYSGYYIKFIITELPVLKSKLFCVNRFNLFSFCENDHGYKNEKSLYLWVQETLEKAGITAFKGTVELQTFPRVLGYVFNPVSFFYCYEEEKVKAIICEVNNTFGESHNYILIPNEGQVKYKLPKEFHVSPFYDVAGEYFFDFSVDNKIKIDYFLNGDLQLTTSISGVETAWTDGNLLKLFFRYPLYTMSVVFLIHYQALKLFNKKIKFHKKPKTPEKEFTYEQLK